MGSATSRTRTTAPPATSAARIARCGRRRSLGSTAALEAHPPRLDEAEAADEMPRAGPDATAAARQDDPHAREPVVSPDDHKRAAGHLHGRQPVPAEPVVELRWHGHLERVDHLGLVRTSLPLQ